MIVVLADDLSGATELAAVAHLHGLSAEVQTEFDANSQARVIAVDTNSRTCSREESVARVRAAAARILAAKPEWIYKKTDSVLRGHIRSEISELLVLTKKKRALFIPANPGRGRIIRAGRYFVEGVPLDQTVFANDPDYPATTSNVAEILGRDDSIDVPNIESAPDLARLARTVNESILCAGASEFFAALLPNPAQTIPALARSSGRTLYVCGSAAAWPIRRKQCEERGIPIFLNLQNDVREASKKNAALIAIGDAPPTDLSPRQLEEALADTAKLILDAAPFERVFLEGGATAAAVLRRLNAKRLLVCGHFAKGIAAFQIPGHSFPIMAIKPGSYPWQENVWP